MTKGEALLVGASLTVAIGLVSVALATEGPAPRSAQSPLPSPPVARVRAVPGGQVLGASVARVSGPVVAAGRIRLAGGGLVSQMAAGVVSLAQVRAITHASAPAVSLPLPTPVRRAVVASPPPTPSP